MSDRWPTATVERPCPVCSHTNRCRVAPDGTAAVCWRDSGKVIQCGNGNGHASGTGYIGKAHRTTPTPPAKASRTFPTPEAAIEAAKPRGGTLANVCTYPGDVMRVARFDLPHGGKQFRPIRRTPVGWCIGDPAGPLPLYRLDELPTTGTVWVTEGEKAADAAWTIGLPATTSAHGSSSAKKSDWTPLAGRDVVILCDADEPGRKYARDVAAILTQLGARVKIVELPDLPDGGDVVQYIEQRDSMESEAIAASIIALADAAPAVESVQLSGDSGEPWPDPLPLPAGLPPVEPFNFALLPAALRPWIQDISERMQCPPDYCAATAMIVAGAMIGRKVAIRPKRHDDWQVVVNLFGAMVGRPSLLKSPAMKEVLKYLSRLEVEAKQEHAKLLAEHEAAAMVADVTKKVRKAELKKAVEEGRDTATLAASLAQDDGDAPTRRRYIVNDSTVEKLGVLLAENPNGFLLFLDELISLLRSMEREGHEGDRGFYLTAWAGDSRFTYDRIGRGTLDIEAAIVSIVGSIQPGVLNEYLRGATQGGAGDDGLMQRFQMTVWPDAPATWRNVDRYPNAEAKATAHAALQRLADLAPGMVEAERDNFDRDALPFLRFDADGQAAFDGWRASLEQRLRSGSDHPAVESHLAKYRSLIPSLALILHLLDGGIGPVSADATLKAIGWGRYLESHARRLYGAVTDAPAVAARLLAGKIKAGDVPNPFAARDVYRNGWAGLDKDRTESAIDVLLSLKWLEERIEPTATNKRTRYAINPKIEIPQKGELTKLTNSESVSFVSDLSEDIPNFDAPDSTEPGEPVQFPGWPDGRERGAP